MPCKQGRMWCASRQRMRFRWSRRAQSLVACRWAGPLASRGELGLDIADWGCPFVANPSHRLGSAAIGWWPLVNTFPNLAW
jgi:hypothetical protein